MIWNKGSQNSELTEEESLEVARKFVLNSPTYNFDGQNLTHVETLYPEIANKTNLYTFVFEFKSTHGGYGDRTGEPVTQVITPHTAHITVENGEVIKANLDQKWDMINQKMIQD
ncbi:MAG: hypothetical protein BTN85_1377 [Candidatus Methanohalarchaeum thermophilum]|uniref:Uncharacterized protein n=1 Tax=Methanohalarchaeum thermophilum TaxID=1903181 RepID=A0A1Q6DWZ1_METT1|nr:MAG: hypothetical protein BTN85_1377 [Candidatus Methanohalarchaeum thermophilum]